MADGIRPEPIHVRGGEPYAHPWYFLDADTRLPMSQAGQTVKAQIRPYRGATELVVEFGVDLTAWVADGMALLTLTAAQADLVADRFDLENRGVMDVQVTTGGIPYTYMTADVTAEPDVTR